MRAKEEGGKDGEGGGKRGGMWRKVHLEKLGEGTKEEEVRRRTTKWKEAEEEDDDEGEEEVRGRGGRSERKRAK